MKKGEKSGTIKVLQLGSPIGLYGAERWILALIKHLDPGKIESSVASIKDHPSLEVPLCLQGEKLGFKTRVFESWGKASFSAVKQLREYIQENKIDILHTHYYKTDIIGLMATRGTRCKILSTPHGWTKAPDLKLRIYEIVDRLIFPFLDAVVPLSESLFRPLRSIPGLRNKLSLIKNGVDLTEIETAGEIAPEILSLKEKGEFVIGYIGRLTPGKGLEVLLDAMANHGKINWTFAILGEGEQEGELRNLAKKLGIDTRVKFFGFRSDRLAFLKGFDVFVLPSRSEGIPRCLMEAMGAGVPVVASDIPGCRVLVDGNTTGLLFQVDNPAHLALLINKIEVDSGLRQNLSQAAREFIKREFSAEKMAGDYENLYLALNQPSKRPLQKDCLNSK